MQNTNKNDKQTAKSHNRTEKQEPTISSKILHNKNAKGIIMVWFLSVIRVLSIYKHILINEKYTEDFLRSILYGIRA